MEEDVDGSDEDENVVEVKVDVLPGVDAGAEIGHDQRRQRE